MEERKNRVIISVSRQFGSGGHKIAEALAEHFELPIYDHRMLDSIAKEKGVDPRVLEKYDEKPLNRFLAQCQRIFKLSGEQSGADAVQLPERQGRFGGIVCGSWTMCGDGFKGI